MSRYIRQPAGLAAFDLPISARQGKGDIREPYREAAHMCAIPRRNMRLASNTDGIAWSTRTISRRGCKGYDTQCTTCGVISKNRKCAAGSPHFGHVSSRLIEARRGIRTTEDERSPASLLCAWRRGIPTVAPARIRWSCARAWRESVSRRTLVDATLGAAPRSRRWS